MNVDPLNIQVGGTGMNVNKFLTLKTFTVYVRAARGSTALKAVITKNDF